MTIIALFLCVSIRIFVRYQFSFSSCIGIRRLVFVLLWYGVQFIRSLRCFSMTFLFIIELFLHFVGLFKHIYLLYSGKFLLPYVFIYFSLYKTHLIPLTSFSLGRRYLRLFIRLLFIFFRSFLILEIGESSDQCYNYEYYYYYQSIIELGINWFALRFQGGFLYLINIFQFLFAKSMVFNVINISQCRGQILGIFLIKR